MITVKATLKLEQVLDSDMKYLGDGCYGKIEEGRAVIYKLSDIKDIFEMEYFGWSKPVEYRFRRKK